MVVVVCLFHQITPTTILPASVLYDILYHIQQKHHKNFPREHFLRKMKAEVALGKGYDL